MTATQSAMKLHGIWKRRKADQVKDTDGGYTAAITKDTDVTKKVEPPKLHLNHKQTAASLDKRHRHRRERHRKRLRQDENHEGLEENATGAGGSDTKNNNAVQQKYYEWKEKGKGGDNKNTTDKLETTCRMTSETSSRHDKNQQKTQMTTGDLFVCAVFSAPCCFSVCLEAKLTQTKCNRNEASRRRITKSLQS